MNAIALALGTVGAIGCLVLGIIVTANLFNLLGLGEFMNSGGNINDRFLGTQSGQGRSDCPSFFSREMRHQIICIPFPTVCH